jgi:hypothetical protein
MRYLDVFSDGNQVPSKTSDFDCDSCLRSKSVHHVPKPVLDEAKNTFDVIHSDVHGPLAVQSLGGKKYFVTFIDENSCYTWIYFLRHKSDVKSVLRDFWNLVETQFSTKIKKFKSDNSGEYVNKDVSEFLGGKGMIHELSPPYAHERNGLPERINRTIVTIVRTMTLDVNDELPVG